MWKVCKDSYCHHDLNKEEIRSYSQVPQQYRSYSQVPQQYRSYSQVPQQYRSYSQVPQQYTNMYTNLFNHNYNIFKKKLLNFISRSTIKIYVQMDVKLTILCYPITICVGACMFNEFYLDMWPMSSYNYIRRGMHV